MKVLIVNTYDIQGGAARAAYRLHRALIAKSVNSLMLVQFKASDDFSVLSPLSTWAKLLGRIRFFFDIFLLKKYKNRKKILFSSANIPFTDIAERINALEPDIVHLHWVAGGFFDIKDLIKIKAPIVWTFHDDWPITGGCHIKWDCDMYKTKCQSCPVLSSDKVNDLSNSLFERKLKYVSMVKHITVVAVSKWLKDCVSESPIFKGRDVAHLPNLIDLNKFSAFDKAASRKLLNLPLERKLILFGAMNATGDINKGFSFLLDALNLIDADDVELVVFGSGPPAIAQNFRQKVHYLGQLNDDVSLRLVFNAADVMLVPSIQESFGQTAVEAMACGTPVVAFATSGLLDIIDHKINGYLADKYNISDFSAGIRWVLYEADRALLASESVAKVRSHFSEEVVSTKYIDLYEKIIKSTNEQ